MNDRCNDLDLFFDRELEPEAAQAFRIHLATCARCQEALEGLVMEAALIVGERAIHRTYPPRPPSPPPPNGPSVQVGAVVANEPAPTKQSEDDKIVSIMTARTVPDSSRLPKASVVASVGGIAAVAAIFVVILRFNNVTPQLTLAPKRQVEVRFSAPELDRHRDLLVVRGADQTPNEHIAVQYLAVLEQRHETNLLVGAHALNDELVSAANTAEAQNLGHRRDTADLLSDRAAIALLQASKQKPSAERELELQRALSLASEALRKDKDHVQALWNRGLALRALDLPLVAEGVFHQLAARGEPGWSAEAKANEQHLHRARETWDDWKRRKHNARQMALGGDVLRRNKMASPAAQLAPSLVRDELYLAIATAATYARFDELAVLAQDLDSELATQSLTALIAKLRGSDLAVRAPLALAFADALRASGAKAALDAIRTNAIKSGVTDIALATFLVTKPSELEAEDLEQLDRLIDARDPWWQLFQLERHAYAAEYVLRDYAAVDAIARQAAPSCTTLRAASCIRITRIAGSATGSMGRIDDALRLLAEARQRAHEENLFDDEVAAIYAIGQLMSVRLTDQLDSPAIANAYLQEAELRWGGCAIQLQRLDFEAHAALLYHRFDEARNARARADALESDTCTLRFNGETVRARLALQKPSADDQSQLKTRLPLLRTGSRPSFALWIGYLAAIEQLLRDPGAGKVALRAIIQQATVEPSRPYAPMVRGFAFDVMIDTAAAAGHDDEVMSLIAERAHAPIDARCVLGVASWNNLIVAVRDASGRTSVERRVIPAGSLRIPTDQVVSPEMQQQLATCPQVQVLASGPYFGVPRLLPDALAWSYRSGAPLPASTRPPRELVVSDVAPPERLQLPRLRGFEISSGGDQLTGLAATPDRVLERMADASLIVIVSHGFTDVSEPSAASLVLSPNTAGDYLLTASKVQAAKLNNAPIVILAGCDVGRVQVTNEPWSLATSFLSAGARSVIAPTEPIPDDGADQVFRAMVDRIRAGENAAVVLAGERVRQKNAGWLSSIVVFER